MTVTDAPGTLDSIAEINPDIVQTDTGLSTIKSCPSGRAGTFNTSAALGDKTITFSFDQVIA